MVSAGVRTLEVGLLTGRRQHCRQQHFRLSFQKLLRSISFLVLKATFKFWDAIISEMSTNCKRSMQVLLTGFQLFSGVETQLK